MQQLINVRSFPSIRRVNIFDLDGTVIDSFHRVRPHLDDAGNLDLAGYISEACTHEKIMDDELLPLAEVMKTNIKDGETHNIVVTARTTYKSDYYYLRKQGLLTHQPQAARLMTRTTLHKYFDLSDVPEIYSSRDAEYKRKYFEVIRAMYPNAEITVFDDHQGVLKVAAEMGFKVVDAVLFNDAMSVCASMAGAEVADDLLSELTDPEYLSQHLADTWVNLTDDERALLTATVHQLGSN